MIESRLSYRFVYKILVFYIFINIFIVSISSAVLMDELPRTGDFLFNVPAIAYGNMVLFIICAIFFLIRMRDTYEITVSENKVLVKKGFSKQFIEFDLSEIAEFEWKRTTSSMSGRGGSASSSTMTVCITFSDGSELPITDYEYANYDELKDFFYAYCKANGLIRETTGQTRRRKRMMGR